MFFAIQYSDGRHLRGKATRQDRVFGFKTKRERSLWIAGGADQARRDALAAADARVKRAKYIMYKVEAAGDIGLSWETGVPLRPQSTEEKKFKRVYRVQGERGDVPRSYHGYQVTPQSGEPSGGWVMKPPPAD